MFRLAAPILLAQVVLTGCSVAVHDSQRLGRAAQRTDSVVLIWAQPSVASFGYLPAMGASLITTPRSTFQANVDTEYLAFGDAIERQIGPAAWPAEVSLVALPPSARQAQVDAAVRNASASSAVIVLGLEGVTAYCTAGCYAFDVRVRYLSPQSRTPVWSGLLTVPPKVTHRDPFDPRTLDFLRALRDELDRQRLIGASQDEAQPIDRTTPPPERRPPMAHRRLVPPETGFADVGNVEAVPVRPEGKDRYRYYLGLPSPKAFVVYAGGGWRFFYRDPDAMAHALDRCQADGATCWLYAVDDRVVWDAVRERRIGRSEQLRDR